MKMKDYSRIPLLLVSLALAVCVVYSENISGMKEECKMFHNGCSGPTLLERERRMKKFFEPACMKHDICYSCVSLVFRGGR